MKIVIVAFLIIGSITQTYAQEQLGFSPSDTTGPSLKLDGLVMQKVSGGYLALSVPPKDIMRFIALAKMMEPHAGILAVIESLENESRKLTPPTGSPAVPIGVCFLATDEIFLHRHKILNRNVQLVGTYSYLNMHNKTIYVQAYSGGPNDHERSSAEEALN